MKFKFKFISGERGPLACSVRRPAKGLPNPHDVQREPAGLFNYDVFTISLLIPNSKFNTARCSPLSFKIENLTFNFSCPHTSPTPRLPILNHSRRIASDDGSRRNIFDDDRTRGNDCSATNSHARSNKCVCADPHLGFDCDRRREEWKVRERVIMRPGTEMGPLRN